MRTEKELLKEIQMISGAYNGLYITEEELETIECMEEVENCEYVGLKDGHDGEETYHITLFGDNEVKSLYVK